MAASTKKTDNGKAQSKATARTETKPKARADLKLMAVRPGRVLLWPNGTKRGGEGYVVRRDDPFVQDYRAVFTDAPEGSKVDAVNDPLWSRNARALGYQFGKGYDEKAAKRVQKEEDEQAEKDRMKEGGVQPVDLDGLPDATA